MTLTPLEPWIAQKIGLEGRPLDLEALRTYQLAKLNETLALVQERSRFYRRLLGSSGLRLSSLEDLGSLPTTSSEDIRRTPLDFLCVAQHEVERIVTLPTSGTTGLPKRVFFTAKDQELTTDFFHRGMSTMVGPGDRVLILLPGSLPGSVGALLKEGLARLDVEGIPHGPVADAWQALDVIDRERVTALVGVPIQVLALVKRAQADHRPAPASLKSVLLSTDRVPGAIAQMIEQAWGCDVYNHYGATEMGLGGGVDCRERSCYHLREADLLFEIVDLATGQPVPEGESGEVAFSTLTREAMPLLRYRTGDISRIVVEPCPCGTRLKRMAHVDERVSGRITLPSGRTLSQGDFDEVLLPIDGLSDFKVLFARNHDHARVVIRIRRGEAGSGPDTDEIMRSLTGIPALAAEMAEGRLSLEVSDWENGDTVNTGTAKRKIEHLQATRSARPSCLAG
jgi:phenylacetate-CoA ligase